MVWFKRFLKTEQKLKYRVKQCAVEFLPVFECTGATTGAPTSINSSYSRVYATQHYYSRAAFTKSVVEQIVSRNSLSMARSNDSFYKGPLLHSREGDTQRAKIVSNVRMFTTDSFCKPLLNWFS